MNLSLQDETVWSFYDNTYETLDKDSFIILLEEQSRRLGFELFVYFSFQLGQLTFYSCSKNLLIESYIDQRAYGLDPVIVRAQNCLTPLYWNTRHWDIQLSSHERHLLSLWSEMGIENGVSIPVHGPGSHSSILCLCSTCRAEENTSISSEIDAALLLLGAHVTIVFQHQPLTSKTPALTSREIDCLCWTARGKTALEVGNILDISERTVRFHLSNIMRKLNVKSKYQAVLKAVNVAGLIY